MSGTSMDGIDVALLETDGESFVRAGASLSRPYAADLREALLQLPAEGVDLAPFDRKVTDAHITAVREFCTVHNISLDSLDCIGFHGQTIRHEPGRKRTLQLGNGARMARALGCVVINRFRDADLVQGGQGAPLAPAYHRALAKSDELAEPIAILNIGGVSNVTLIFGDAVYACDCGPGNALIDDWVRARTHLPFDEDGRISASGTVSEAALAQLMNHAYFSLPGAKSLDRNHFSAAPVQALSTEDGAATLVAFTARAIASAARLLPTQASTWVVVGGGRLNRTLLSRLRAELNAQVLPAEELGWAGDAIEAQAFAYLAVRSLRGLPLSWPTTTGVTQPTSGGVRHDPHRPVRAVLFDLDGTLLDTAPDLCGAVNELRLERGLSALPFESLRPHSSKGARGLIALAFAHTEGEERAACISRFLALYRDRLTRETRFFDEVLRLLDELERAGIRWGIVTNKATWLTEPLLEAMGLAARSHVVVCGDTLHERKPSPLPLLHAAEQLGVSPAECLFIGDAESDMRAADAAGMLPLAVRFGYIAEDDKPHEWPAHAWLDSPLQVLDWLKR